MEHKLAEKSNRCKAHQVAVYNRDLEAETCDCDHFTNSVSG